MSRGIFPRGNCPDPVVPRTDATRWQVDHRSTLVWDRSNRSVDDVEANRSWNIRMNLRRPTADTAICQRLALLVVISHPISLQRHTCMRFSRLFGAHFV